MSQRIDVHITNPLTGEELIRSFQSTFTIGSCEPSTIVVKGDFLEAEHGIFDYSQHVGWYYLDSNLKNSSKTSVKSKEGKINYCEKGKIVSLKSDDTLILNKSVTVRVLKVSLHDGRQL